MGKKITKNILIESIKSYDATSKSKQSPKIECNFERFLDDFFGKNKTNDLAKYRIT